MPYTVIKPFRASFFNSGNRDANPQGREFRIGEVLDPASAPGAPNLTVFVYASVLYSVESWVFKNCVKEVPAESPGAGEYPTPGERA
jgi:hypothetical protein